MQEVASQKRFLLHTSQSFASVRCVTLVLQLATLLYDAFYPRKDVQKAKDSGPCRGAYSAPPEPQAGFEAVSP